MSGIDFSSWSCPLPLLDYPNVVIGHGGGGQLSAELIEHLFLPAFRNEELEALGDAALLPAQPGRLAFSTDSFVVHPLFFPGGSIGDLAVYGTVNDLAMSGARPLYLSAAFILEEGLDMGVLGTIVTRMAEAARDAGVRIATGDTKVVERGRGHGCYITTSGVGLVPPGLAIGPDRARPGDVVLVSGTIGDHGMAVMSVREGLQFGTVIESDSAPLAGLVAVLLGAAPSVRALRDPTRGGVASSLNEIAARSRVGINLEERAIPVRSDVQAACELLGMDPIYVANEGKLLAIVDPADADAALAALRAHPLGRQAAIIGRVTDRHPGMLVAKTGIGATRVIPMQLGEQLPRIC
ncbi:MAG TPA: hydrogenase expression/formation protein HypE [Thermoanaerobaculia bacterium]|nr:hydrogenase expression/formation protein HypE [Thermoanaerobaculia bacterium]